MIELAMAKLLRGIGPPLLVWVALIAVSWTPAAAQPQQPQQPRNPVCTRLESQLAMVDRGVVDPARADQVKRLEDAAGRQQQELDRVTARARQMGCEGRGFFSLFSGQPPQCGPINNQTQQLRANLDRALGELQNLQGNSADREGQRRTILASLGQNDCGPQYRTYANRGGGGFFENLFGPGSGPGTILNNAPDVTLPGNTYRTLCVRTCDGYYFPISYSALPSKFDEDSKACQAMCPASEAALYSHRNPGEDVAQAVSIAGRPYTELPNAFAYRKTFNPSCSCRGVGQTWADALKHLEDSTIERGDIVVNAERARALSQPTTDAQGRPIRPPPAQAKGSPAAVKGAPAPKSGPAAAAAPEPPPEQPQPSEPGRRQVRTVGPQFLPTR
jgi:hypothetical protein